MEAEIISVGTELLLGHTINTDAAFVARELASLGIGLRHTQVVGDNAEELEKALRLASERSDIIVTTGGLGPTADDLTKETVAGFAGVPLVEDAASLASLREYFGDRHMSQNQYKQAMLPGGATVFANICGTAPGCAVPLPGNKVIIMLPGPPRELEPMFKNEVVPYLAQKSGGCIQSHMVRTFGIGEGEAAQRLGSLLQGENPTAATYATDGEMFVKITARAENATKAEELAMPLVDKVCATLGEVVYGIDAPSLESRVVELLLEHKKTVATAESCTGGLLAKRITDRPGSSAVFGLGLVTYANEAKEKMLGVPREMLERHGAVSEQVARSMAMNARRLAHSDFGIGITGIAGPDGATPQKPLGLVYIAMAFENGIWLREMRCRGRYPGRQWIRQRASGHALDLLRRYLTGIGPDLQEK